MMNAIQVLIWLLCLALAIGLIGSICMMIFIIRQRQKFATEFDLKRNKNQAMQKRIVK